MPFQSLLKRIASTLDSANIPYMIIGGQAVLVHGELRVTKDIDVTLGIPPFDPEPLLSVVRKLGLKVLVSDVKEFLEKTFVLPAEDSVTGIRVDLICSLSEYERAAIGRAIDVDIDGQQVRFVGLEDLLIHKLIAGRPRDIEDARAIILKNPDYDQTLVRKWLLEHDRELGADFEQRLNDLLKKMLKGE